MLCVVVNPMIEQPAALFMKCQLIAGNAGGTRLVVMVAHRVNSLTFLTGLNLAKLLPSVDR